MENTVDYNEYDLLEGVSSYHENLIIENVISKLKALQDPNLLLSGDDSGLKNTWEEICSQVQGEQSFHWDVYINTIENFIDIELKNMNTCLVNVLNYIYYYGISEDNKDDKPGLVQSILEDILFKAELFKNSNIENYLNDDYEEEEEEDDENEQEDDDEYEDEVKEKIIV